MVSREPRSGLHASDVLALIGAASLPKPHAAETGYRLIRLPAAFLTSNECCLGYALANEHHARPLPPFLMQR